MFVYSDVIRGIFVRKERQLVRRAIVNLCRSLAELFSDLYCFDANIQLEAWIRISNMMVYPALWLHYTECSVGEE